MGIFEILTGVWGMEIFWGQARLLALVCNVSTALDVVVVTFLHKLDKADQRSVLKLES